MATSGWVNPLDQLAPIEGHPDLSATSSPCSSPPESPGRYGDLRETCVNILKSYQPVNHLDDTAKVLMAFLDNLCKQGQMVLMEEMDRFDADQLRQLRQFLVDAILRPSTLFLYAYLPLAFANAFNYFSDGSWRASSLHLAFTIKLG